ncbi:MAG: efflux RND transporter periplasmic adaptor subunit [Oscillospiraceae bacterium]
MEQKKKKKGIIIAIVVVVLLAGIGVGVTSCMRSVSSSLESMSQNALETVEVEKRDISNDINVSGTVESESLIKVTSTVTAKIKTLKVEIGSEVKKGDILCEFDSSDFQQQYDSLSKTIQNSENLKGNTHRTNERNLQNAKNDKEATLAQAQRAIDEAIGNRDRAYQKETDLVNKYNSYVNQKNDYTNQMNNAMNMGDMDAYSDYYQKQQTADSMMQSIDSQLESLRDTFPSYESAVTSAQEAYRNAERAADSTIQSFQDVLDNEQYSSDSSSQEQLDKLAEQIENCTVKAPRSGIITSLNVAEGSIPTTDALMTIEDKDALKITAQIAESDILKVKEGLPAVIKTTATGDKEFPATVSRVVNIYKAGSANALTGESSGGYSAEITIDEKDSGLLIGMNAKIRIVLDEKKDVLAVPYESIVEEEDGSKHVIIAEKQSDGTYRAKLAKVETGMEGSYYTEVTSTELKEGDRILMSGGDFSDGEILPIFDFSSVVNGEGGADEQ